MLLREPPQGSERSLEHHGPNDQPLDVLSRRGAGRGARELPRSDAVRCLRVRPEDLDAVFATKLSQRNERVGQRPASRCLATDSPAESGKEPVDVRSGPGDFIRKGPRIGGRTEGVMGHPQHLVKREVLPIHRLQHAADLGDAQVANVPQHPNEAEAPNVAVSVFGLVRRGARSPGEEPLTEVVLDGGDGHPGDSTQLGNPHPFLQGRLDNHDG